MTAPATVAFPLVEVPSGTHVAAPAVHAPAIPSSIPLASLLPIEAKSNWKSACSAHYAAALV